MNYQEELSKALESLIVHTANDYGGFQGFDDEGDRDGLNKALAAINALNTKAANVNDKPMPSHGRSGKYVASPQSFSDGYNEALADLRQRFGVEDHGRNS